MEEVKLDINVDIPDIKTLQQQLVEFPKKFPKLLLRAVQILRKNLRKL